MVTLYVTEKEIPMNKALIEKIDLMIKRVTQKNPKLDAVICNEGGEGLGKTTISCAEGYYIAYKTGKKFDEGNVFLDVKKAIDFAKDTEGQIIIFDEPAKAVLRMQWRMQLQQNLIELLMLSRKKRHFIIFNFVKFYKFNEYIVVDRCLAMIHLYERRDKEGYAFAYIPKSQLEDLYNDAIKKHRRTYFLHCIFTGEFPDVLNPEKKYNILDKFDYNKYDKEKDRVISSIGNDGEEKKPINEKDIIIKIIREFKERNPKTTISQLSNYFGISRRTISRYLSNECDPLKNQEELGVGESDIINKTI